MYFYKTFSCENLNIEDHSGGFDLHAVVKLKHLTIKTM